ncbi:MAG TPA: MBL fold metallo-hydrolase [Gammaproteobacteria bacterium]|nr:MBL fold metallo-hydrolase [Gammaproteobacteria bacterium]
MRRWLTALALACLATNAGAETLRLQVLDVGEGQAVLLQHGERGILIDTGHAGQAPKVLRAIADSDIRHLDMLILSHLHPDHASGYFRLREAWPDTPVLDAQHPLPADISPDMVRWVNEALSTDPLRRPLNAGDALPWGDARIEVLWPADFTSDNLNRHSLVLHIRHGERSALLMGDAGKKVERALLQQGKKLTADVLVVGHHGASDAGDTAFLAAVRPAYSVISVNRNNLRGYPHADTLQRLRATGGQILRTDEDGDICLYLPRTGTVVPCTEKP